MQTAVGWKMIYSFYKSLCISVFSNRQLSYNSFKEEL